MKSSKEIAKTVLEERDAHAADQLIRIGRIRKTAAFCAAVSMLCVTVGGIGYFESMQRRLTTVPIHTETTSETKGLECLPEEGNETPGQYTAPTSSSSPMAEDFIGTSSPSEDDQCVLTEQEAFAAETVMAITTNTLAIERPIPQTETSLTASDSVEEQTTEEYSEVPQWDEKTISEQFMEFTAHDTVYGSRCSRIADACIGEKLYDTIVIGFDDYADEIRYADASVYRINGISEECAVSVRFQGYDTGYVYTNRNYFPETLGELMDALNLAETISFHALTPTQGESITEFERSLLMNLLNNHRDLARVDDDSYHEPLFSISTSVELLGIRNKSLKITEDGWLTMNIMEVGYSFCIGEDTAAELSEAIGINFDVSEATVPYAENTETLVLE